MTVHIEKDGEVTIVTLDRPDVRNAVDSETARALHEAFLAFDADSGAKVAVFHGAHGHFCAGWDLQFGAQMLRESPGAESDVFARLDFQPEDKHPAAPMGPSRLLLSKPVIAAVSGAAVAGGMELALWCDMRVMEEDAYFGVYCRRFGVPLIDGGTVRLPRLVGMGHAMDLILTGRKVEAMESLQMGLCNRVVPTGTAREAAQVLAHQLAAFPQKTLLADRQSAYTQWDLPLPQALKQEWDRGRGCIGEGLQGAARFADGQGRHGKF
ncbi:MAG: crotonase/enoyl-CoA hydratase family protein [Hydrogenophaga sp.]|uniref:crotonase/enoyl-CoA hydratase family protein n=1 Tax=Polaromonas sp. TaxID=1869339 RepID=UPI00272F4DBD|nr:crotonase/enoyl-CoA hydratase family protein [Polaromonas sp.]MDP2450357.1 crotonase/enoyl-CoA hydratase family protein [Polaromonas sp.]MDP3250412.1 crotonase/enoyl-CoA hydratase family protein [Hydrogenophaga sp.]MDP3756144.1 crotonase/enoyl-CoA hydratase family protein [Polaromonas sp.]